jgi:hypothetical protein
MITFRFVDDAARPFGRQFQYKTLAGAQAKAHRLVGGNPRLDPDGYAVHPRTGDCLFFQGVTFEQLFPRRSKP